MKLYDYDEYSVNGHVKKRIDRELGTVKPSKIKFLIKILLSEIIRKNDDRDCQMNLEGEIYLKVSIKKSRMKYIVILAKPNDDLLSGNHTNAELRCYCIHSMPKIKPVVLDGTRYIQVTYPFKMKEIRLKLGFEKGLKL